MYRYKINTYFSIFHAHRLYLMDSVQWLWTIMYLKCDFHYLIFQAELESHAFELTDILLQPLVSGNGAGYRFTHYSGITLYVNIIIPRQNPHHRLYLLIRESVIPLLPRR